MTPEARRARQGRVAQDRGRRFEWRVQQALERLGWATVRSSGSHGPADILAASPAGVRWLVQCKGATHAVSAAELAALEAWAPRWDALVIWAQPAPLGIRWRVRSGDHWTPIDPARGGYLT